MHRISRKSTVLNAVWVGLVMLAASPFAVYAIERAVVVLGALEQSSARFFHAAEPLATISIYAHMLTGGIITLLAPLQLVTGIRQRWPALHRVLGRVVAGLAVITAVGGLGYIALFGTIGGTLMNAGFALYGVLMLLSAGMTVRYAIRSDPRHRLWAERLVILDLASWLYRVHYGIWEVTTGGIGTRPDFSGLFDQVQVFAFYLPYLLIHAWFWQLRHTAHKSLT